MLLANEDHPPSTSLARSAGIRLDSGQAGYARDQGLPRVDTRRSRSSGPPDGSIFPAFAKSVLEGTTTSLIRAELPAVKKEDVKVTVHDATITIEGTRRYEKEIQNEKFHRVESLQGKFLRSLLLPADADQQSIRAESNDGVLVVRVPKAKVEKPKTVQVKIG